MRKLKLQMQVSVDGFVAGSKGEMDWMVWNWDDDLKNYVKELTSPVDCILLGRVLAQGFIPHWAAAVNKPDDENAEFARKMTDTPKVVFSKTLQSSEWANTTLATGEIRDEVAKLKKQEGKDIITYGGAGFTSSLIKHGLIDEYHIFVNPSALGNGMPIWRSIEKTVNLKPKNTFASPCGIVVLCYEPVK